MPHQRQALEAREPTTERKVNLMTDDDQPTPEVTLENCWARAFQTMVAAVLRELGACPDPRGPESLAKPSEDQPRIGASPDEPISCENGSNPRSGECARPSECVEVCMD